MPTTVEIDFDVCDFRHRPIIGRGAGMADARARWPGKLASSVR